MIGKEIDQNVFDISYLLQPKVKNVHLPFPIYKLNK